MGGFYPLGSDRIKVKMVLCMLLIGYWYQVPLSSCLDTIGTINTNMDPTTAVFRSRTLIYAAELYCTIVVIFGNTYRRDQGAYSIIYTRHS